MKRLCVFCGSSSGADDEYRQSARLLGAEMVRRGYSLVFGGGGTGLMGEVADEVRRLDGTAIGVIPECMVKAGLEHRDLTELHAVKTMHERKALMGSLASAFVALPGGLGTFEELLEAFTWVQLGIHQKPVGILNVAGYYDSLIELMDKAVKEGFLKPAQRTTLVTAGSPADLLDQIESYTTPESEASDFRWEEI